MRINKVIWLLIFFQFSCQPSLIKALHTVQSESIEYQSAKYFRLTNDINIYKIGKYRVYQDINLSLFQVNSINRIDSFKCFYIYKQGGEKIVVVRKKILDDTLKIYKVFNKSSRLYFDSISSRIPLSHYVAANLENEFMSYIRKMKFDSISKVINENERIFVLKNFQNNDSIKTKLSYHEIRLTRNFDIIKPFYSSKYINNFRSKYDEFATRYTSCYTTADGSGQKVCLSSNLYFEKPTKSDSILLNKLLCLYKNPTQKKVKKHFKVCW